MKYKKRKNKKRRHQVNNTLQQQIELQKVKPYLTTVKRNTKHKINKRIKGDMYNQKNEKYNKLRTFMVFISFLENPNIIQS